MLDTCCTDGLFCVNPKWHRKQKKTLKFFISHLIFKSIIGFENLALKLQLKIIRQAG